MLVLLRLGFDWHFHDTEARLFLKTTYLGYGYVSDGLVFMILDVGFVNPNVSFSLFASSHNYGNDVNLWHARLGYISQNCMQSLQ